MTVKKMFYSMGEVSEMFDVNPSLIRHWESKFDCLRPHKNKKGNRMFSPSDVEKLKQIYHLVKERGMTLEGANKAMKGSRGGVSRDTELLERLQRIRAALEEVREELRDGSQDEIVDTDAYLVPDAAMPSEMTGTAEDTAPKTDMASAVAAGVADGAEAEGGVSDAESAEGAARQAGAKSPALSDMQPGPEAVGVAEESAESVPEQPQKPQETPSKQPQPAVAAGAVSPKSRTRRRRKSDDEDKDKELFPFYEQSLF